MNSHHKLFFSKLLALTITILIFQVSLFVEPVAGSEEENIDDFAVHPAQRWDSITDEAVDTITGDSYEIYSKNNATTGNTEFEKSRGLRTQDMKVNSLLKVDTGGGETEFSRDNLGSAWDFNTDGDSRGWSGLVSQTVSGGILAGNMAAAASDTLNLFSYDATGIINQSVEVYHTFKARIKSNVDDLKVIVQFFVTDGSKNSAEGFVELTTDWQDLTWDFTASSEYQRTLFSIRFLFDEINGDGTLEATDKVFIENIELIGSLDYATTIIGDTWDWEDSLEYWTDVETDTEDFEDDATNWQIFSDPVEGNNGTLKGIKTINGGKWLHLEIDNDPLGYATINSSVALTIDASVYDWLTIEWFFNDTVTPTNISSVDIYDSAKNLVGSDSTGYDLATYNNTRILSSIELSDAAWTGTETDVIIEFLADANDPGVEIFLNWTYLYDVELGDLESWDFLERMHINPAGYFVGNMVAAASDVLLSPSSLSMDTSSFTTLTMRIRSGFGSSIKMDIRGTVDSGTEFFGSRVTLNSTFDVFILDLSSDSDWAGTLTRVRFDFVKFSGGSFNGSEFIEIDYILFTGNWSTTDGFSLELQDTNQEKAMDFKFTRSSTDISDHELTISLFDSSGEAYSDTTSFTYDQSTDGWLDFSFRLDTIEKEFRFDLKYDNNTEIIDINRFSDVFTNLPVNLKIFSGNNLSLALNNTVGALARSLVILDYINAPFVERNWKQISNPIDSDWIVDSSTSFKVQKAVSNTSIYSLSVPYLDAITASFTLQWDESQTRVGDQISYAIEVYVVDKNDGDLHKISDVSFGLWTLVANNDSKVFVRAQGSSGVGDFEITGNSGIDAATGYMSVGLTEDRNIIETTVWAEEITGGTGFTKLASNTTVISDVTSEASQEFVIYAKATAIIAADAGNQVAYGTVNSLVVVKRESFAGIKPGPLPPSGNENHALNEGVDFFTALINAVLGIPGAIIDGLLTLGADILGGLTALGASILGGLTALGSTITGAIGNIASDIWAGIGSALDFITEAIADIAIDVITALTNALGDIVDDVITAALGLASDLADMLFAMLEFLFVLLVTAAELLVNIAAAILFFFWDALGLPNLLLMWDFFAATIIDLATGVPAVLADMLAWFFEIYIFIPIAMFAFMWLIPAFKSSNIGEFFSEFFRIAFTDVTGGLGIFGWQIPIPYVVIIIIFMIPYGAGIIPSLGTSW